MPSSVVARKLYLTVLGLAAAWAVGVIAWFAFLLRQDQGVSLDVLGALLVAAMSLGPLAAVLALNRWWRWLRT